MIRDITLGQYFPGTSLVHQLDPRTKIGMTALFIAFLFIIEGFVGYLFLSALVLIVVAISHIPLKYVLKGLKPLWFLVCFTAILNIFLTEGTIVYQWGVLKVTVEGLELAVIMTMRLVLLLLGTSMLTFTTSPIALTDGIEKLLSPFQKIGVPAHELAMMMTIALRFIPTLLEETDKIMKAQMARGADFESGNLIQRAKGMIPLLVPLFISAFRRADELAIAMESRCYRGGEGRTRMKELKMQPRDGGAFILLLFLLFIAYWCNLHLLEVILHA